MERIIRRGISCAMPQGAKSAFTPRMFVASRNEWKKKMETLRKESDYLFDEFYPDAYNGGNCGPCGAVVVQQRNGYVYVYMIDAYGDMDSEMFTHSVIAGKYTEVPPYGGYQNQVSLSQT